METVRSKLKYCGFRNVNGVPERGWLIDGYQTIYFIKRVSFRIDRFNKLRYQWEVEFSAVTFILNSPYYSMRCLHFDSLKEILIYVEGRSDEHI